MKRINIIKLKPNKLQEKILKECMFLSSCVYNSANYIVRQQFFKKEKISSFFNLIRDLQKSKDYQLLGRVYSSPRIQIYSESISSLFKLIKSKTQKQVGLPKYYKNRKTNTTISSYLVMDNYQYFIGKNKVIIPLSRQMRKKYNVKHFKIEYSGNLKFKGKQLRGQIHYKNKKFYLYQSVEISDKNPIKSDIYAGLDLGIKNLLTVYTSNNYDKIIGSNRFYRQWQYLTELISKEQKKLSEIKRYTSNNLKKLYNKRTKYLNNLFNNIIAKMFRFIKRNNVSVLIVGDIKNIRENKSKNSRLNQMINNYWSFDILLKKIKNKCEECGIKLHIVTEEYTSRICPICGYNSEKNCKDRIFICEKCSYIDHRDIVGARNIMMKGMNDLVNKSVHWCEIMPLEVSQ